MTRFFSPVLAIPLLALALLLGTVMFLAGGESASAANFTVTKTADTNDGTCDADCSLREAITAAEAAPGADTVVFDAGVFPAGAPATIAVGSGLPTSFDTTIDGTGAGVVIDGTGAPGATGLNFNSGGVLTGATVRNVTIRNFDTGINMNALTDNNGATIDGVVLDNNGDGININAGDNTNNASITTTTVTNSDGDGININAGTDNSGSSISGSTVDSSADTGININSGGDNINTAITNSTVTASGDAGVVLNAGGELTGATVTGSNISGNGTVDGNGIVAFGGNASPPGLTVTNSTISNNITDNNGGGIHTRVDTVISGSTISGNTGDDGGGIEASAVLRITNSTISGNTALVDGGGISSGAPANGGSTLFLTNVTIVGNTAQTFDTGGGIQVRGTADVLNTIIANNTDQGSVAPDCDGNINSLGNNLIEDTTGCNITGVTTGNITGTDPGLLALANNGGATMTHAFAAGAPPHNAGTNSGCPATDQRGVTRPQEGTCDIGAYEFQVVTPAPSGTPTQAPVVLPPTGGPADDGTSHAWLIALAILALAAITGAGTLAVARRRD